MTYIIV